MENDEKEKIARKYAAEFEKHWTTVYQHVFRLSGSHEFATKEAFYILAWGLVEALTKRKDV